ncbi:universal stress protein [Deinococcus sp.]|uniref:universal stress protein n=1 Tax=Deinococcus sp. TaxID=47478 RepID=UPI0025FD2177|nr:universal stress protein [Deinococcus sp.]
MTTPSSSQSSSPQPFARIAIGVDFSGSADHALQLARARFPGAERLLVHVVDLAASALPDVSGAGLIPITSTPRLIQELSDIDKRRLDGITQPGESQQLVTGDPAVGLIEAARAWNADLIVVGTHHQGAIEHFFSGSVAESVVKRSPLPVLVIRSDARR